VLRAAAGLAGLTAIGAGAGGGDGLPGPSTDPPPTQLLAVLQDAVNMRARYEVALANLPVLAAALSALRDAHAAHAQTLSTSLGVSVPAPEPTHDIEPLPTEPVRAIAALAGAERAGRESAAAACLVAIPRLAPLVGSIAAARASHVEVLK
jgi:hypothetical protein